MEFKVYDIFYSQFSATIASIFTLKMATVAA
jgi:hypothetical protein